MMRAVASGAILLLALAGCSGSGTSAGPHAAPGELAGVDWPKAERVEVALSDFRFTPDRVRLKAHTPYVLRLRNTGSGTHAFTAPAFFKASAVDKILVAGGAAAGTGTPGDIEVRGAETKEVYLVSGDPGTYDLTCSEFLHGLFGMNGAIVVE
jgi:uncharacterized cupredoxin-like copper-binding protein